jgi:hypothetical protein
MNLTASWAQTSAGFNSLTTVPAPDVPVSDFFPDGLPGPGEDTGPLEYHDYDFSQINDYSNLSFNEVRISLGARQSIAKHVGIFGAVSFYNVNDNDPYLEDLNGYVTLVSGGLSWLF